MTDHPTDNAADRSVVEQAKGALMLHYGVSSYESLAAMARWAREAGVSVPEVAHALVKGVCQGRVTQETEGMVRWLEQRLRAGIGEAAGVADESVGRRSGVAGHTRTSAWRLSPSAAAPQWRYASAVHAARGLNGR